MRDRRSTVRAALILILPLALACSGGSSGNGRPTPDGGSTTGKKDGAVTRDTAPPMTGTPIKFCNALALQGNQNLQLTLKLGDPPLLLTASSGGCSTEPGTLCQTIAPGEHVVAMVDDQDTPIAEGMITIGEGEEWMVLATLDRMTSQPTVLGGALRPGFTCADLDPFARPDGGASGGADAGADR